MKKGSSQRIAFFTTENMILYKNQPVDVKRQADF